MNVYQSVCANFEAQKPSWLSDKIAAGVGVMGFRIGRQAYQVCEVPTSKYMVKILRKEEIEGRL